MKTHQPTGLGRSIVNFFQEYLPTLRGMSRHTIQSYRDGLVLFLKFAAIISRPDASLIEEGEAWRSGDGRKRS